MPIALELHPTPKEAGSIDWSRVRILDRGTCLLVMDRVSGKWITVDRALAPLLPLLPAGDVALPGSARARLTELRALLADRGVGIVGTERKFGALTTIILKLTSACNYACAYCYDYEAIERARTMTFDTGCRAIDQALDLVATDLWVILHGGEPTLVWGLVESLVLHGERRACEGGKRIHFVGQTNLSRLDDRMVAFSRAHGLVWGISVDGSADIHDHFRTTHAGEGTYHHFTEGLERHPEFVRRCGILSTITEVNQGRLLETARHFRDLGMPSWDWSLFQPIGRGRAEASRFALDRRVLVPAWGELFDAVLAGDFAGFAVLPVTKYVDNFLTGPGANMCMRSECGAARDLLSVSADGSIQACDCIDPRGPIAMLGSLRTGNLADARRSETAERIRGRDLSRAPCADCIWYGVCGGTCLAHAPSVNEVWEDACAVAMQAFDRISNSLTEGDALLDYMASLPTAA